MGRPSNVDLILRNHQRETSKIVKEAETFAKEVFRLNNETLRQRNEIRNLRRIIKELVGAFCDDSDAKISLPKVGH